MAGHTVSVFHPHPFEVGEKIFIDGGTRAGDWEVIGFTERKVKLRCPVSGTEVEWDRFCYLVEKKEGEPWPHK